MEEYQDVEDGEFESYQESGEADDWQTGGVDDTQSGMMGYSEPKPLGGLYALFSDVLNRPISTKISNVNSQELGDLGISVRDCLRIAQLAQTFKHPIFARFFLGQAGITTDSSMSKEGWFTELFITSKKQASRVSSSSIGTLPQPNKKKWKLFDKKPGEGQKNQTG